MTLFTIGISFQLANWKTYIFFSSYIVDKMFFGFKFKKIMKTVFVYLLTLESFILDVKVTIKQ